MLAAGAGAAGGLPVLSVRQRQTAAVMRMVQLDGAALEPRPEDGLAAGAAAAAAAASGAKAEDDAALEAAGASAAASGPWRLLIFDEFGRSVISVLLKVGHLRAQGVTLHLPLHAPRQAVPDVPAVYFVRATQANVDRICEDLAARLYDASVLNFTHAVPQKMLEGLAEKAVATECVPLIRGVFDQYVGFVSLEDDLFELRVKDAYARFNDPALSEDDAAAAIDEVAQGLLSVVATLGTVPVIRCPAGGGAALAVAQRLNALLVDILREEMAAGAGGGAGAAAGASPLFLSGRTSVAALQHSPDRPLLVIADRNAVGPGVLLRHAWTYQAMAHDTLGLDLNKIQLDTSKKRGGVVEEKKEEIMDLDSSADVFWRTNAMSPFPEIAVAVKGALGEYQTALEEFQALSQGTGLSSQDVAALAEGRAPSAESAAKARSSNASAADLAAFVSSVPALRNQKRQIDMHTNVATALLGHIRARGIDALVALEEPASTGEKPLTAAAVLAILQDASDDMFDANTKPNFRDKLRLFALFLLQQADAAGEGAAGAGAGASSSSAAAGLATQTELDACEAALRRACTEEGADTALFDNTLKFVRHLRGLLAAQKRAYALPSGSAGRPAAAGAASGGSAAGGGGGGSMASLLGGNLSTILSGQGNDLADQTRTQLTTLFSAGVKAFMPSKSSKLPLTELVETLMENKSGDAAAGGAGGAGGGAGGGGAQSPVDAFVYLDPLHSARGASAGAAAGLSSAASAAPAGPPRRRTTPFRDAVAFVVGGGNFVEHHNIRSQITRDTPLGSVAPDAAHALPGTNARRRVVYGATDLPTGEQFLAQLASLGEKMV